MSGQPPFEGSREGDEPMPHASGEDAISVASRALQLMTRHGVESTPENFEVWFKFALGRTPELTRTIEILISNKRSFDAATNRSLFSTFAAPLPDRADQEVTDRLGRILAEARRFVQRSLEANREHMNALGSVAAQIGEGEDAAQIIKALLDELAKATTRAADAESHFSASLRELEKVRNTLAAAEQRSNTDPLTGLANRHALGEFCRRAQMLAMESGQPLSLLMIDIDHFKQFNDRFGHQFGDQVIRLVASVLKEGLRGDDLAARYGGEELVGVLPGANLARCEEAAERIRQTIAKRQVTRRATGEALARVTVSVGVAQFVPGETLAELIERCDRALYAAKRGGRNRTVTERDADGPVAAGSLPRYGARGRPFHSGTPNSCRG